MSKQLTTKHDKLKIWLRKTPKALGIGKMGYTK